MPNYGTPYNGGQNAGNQAQHAAGNDQGRAEGRQVAYGNSGVPNNRGDDAGHEPATEEETTRNPNNSNTQQGNSDTEEWVPVYQ